MTFQENLRKYREAAGWKYARDFADHVGIKYSTYIGYETQNREPKYEVLIQIAKALGVTTDDLLGYHPDELQKALADLKSCGLRVEKGIEHNKNDENINTNEEVFYVVIELKESDSQRLSDDKDSRFNIIGLKKNEIIDIYHEVMNSGQYREMKRNLYCQDIFKRILPFINVAQDYIRASKKEKSSKKEI